MPSMLVWSSAVPPKAYGKSLLFMLSKAFAGKLVSDEQKRHASRKVVALEVLIKGKLVSDEQPRHA